jgi:hypothetical protein
VRIAITTTEKTTPPEFKIKAVASNTKCPKQLLLLPGISIGPVHLGFTKADASHAAKLYDCAWQGTLPTGDKAQYCVFNEGPWVHGLPQAPVGVYFLNGRVAMLAVADDQQFRATTGILTWTPLCAPDCEPFPGSTEFNFKASHAGVECSTSAYDLGSGEKNDGCYYHDSVNRYTFAVAAFEQCTRAEIDAGPCYFPEPDFYVTGMGVATPYAFSLAKDCVLEGKNCPPGLG